MTPALIAITGADGFIGRATTAALGAAGFDLRLHGGPPAAARMSPRGQSLHDAFDLSADDAATRLGALLLGCDVVVHLAGPPHIVGPSASARRALEGHVTGTALVAQAAARRGCALVYVSSAAVYGRERAGRAGTESDAVERPDTPYGHAKWAAEHIVRAWGQVLPAVVLRPTQVYGPGGHAGTLVADLVAQAASGREPAPRDPGAVVDLVHVSDVAAAIVHAVKALVAAPVAGIADVRSGAPLTAAEVARCLWAGERALETPRAPSGVGVLGGWSPTTPLHEGLRALFTEHSRRGA